MDRSGIHHMGRIGSELPACGHRGKIRSDTWTVTSVSNHNLNNPRSVWTGSEAILYRAQPGSQYGERYDPVTDVWTPIAFESGPLGDNYSMVWTGSEVLLWGSSSSPGWRS